MKRLLRLWGYNQFKFSGKCACLCNKFHTQVLPFLIMCGRVVLNVNRPMEMYWPSEQQQKGQPP